MYLRFYCAALLNMTAYIRSSLVKIGNSQGFRIPKPLLAKCGINGEVEIGIEADQLIIRPVQHPRAGWQTAFAEMANRGDDVFLDVTTDLMTPLTDWDQNEWEW